MTRANVGRELSNYKVRSFVGVFAERETPFFIFFVPPPFRGRAGWGYLFRLFYTPLSVSPLKGERTERCDTK